MITDTLFLDKITNRINLSRSDTQIIMAIFWGPKYVINDQSLDICSNWIQTGI